MVSLKIAAPVLVVCFAARLRDEVDEALAPFIHWSLMAALELPNGQVEKNNQ